MNILDRIPSWVAFVALILIGVLMIVIGVFFSRTAQAGFMVVGTAAVIVGAVSWAGGAAGKITGREGTIGVRVAIRNLPWWGWLINVLTVAGAVVILVIL